MATGRVIPISKAEAYFIPLPLLKEEDVEAAHRKFTYRFYDDKKCRPCDNLVDRHNDICDSCVGFKGMKRTSKVVTIGGKSFLSLPVGASKKVKKWLIGCGYADNYKVTRKHGKTADFSRKIRVIGTPYDYQEEAKETLLRKKRGILESPPRSGKTVMAACVIAAIGKKTLILGAQREWLMNFQETFIGSDVQDAFTNCKPRQIKLCKTLADFQSTDICLSSFAKFMSPAGKKLLAKIKDLFEVVVVDEVQGLPAIETSRVGSKFNARYYFGLSGTVERKMTEEIQIAHDIIGPIIHSCEVPRLIPRLRVLQPGVKIKDPSKGGSQVGFTYFQTRLESNEQRRNIIIKEVIRLARLGHLVLVPLTRVESVLRWTREINYETETPGFALPFFGGLKKDRRKIILEKARNYQCRVLVGNVSLLSTGVNIPRASCLIDGLVSSNIPKCDQRTSRILTPMEDKPQPLIVYVLDDSDLVRKCKRNEYWNCIEPRFKPIVTKEDKQTLMEYFAGAQTPRTFNLREGV